MRAELAAAQLEIGGIPAAAAVPDPGETPRTFGNANMRMRVQPRVSAYMHHPKASPDVDAGREQRLESARSGEPKDR